MKVLQFDTSPVGRIEDLVANRPPQQAHLASNMTQQPLLANTPTPPQLTEALDALRIALRGHAVPPQLETLVHGCYQTPQQNAYEMELHALRETAAVLTKRCIRLQEQVDVGKCGLPGVMGSMDGQSSGCRGLSRNPAPYGYPAQAPPGLSQAVHSGLDYSVGDPSLQAAHFGQVFGPGAYQDPRANGGYLF
jgi:hypothetical protein